jgi:hypothetical protein
MVKGLLRPGHGGEGACMWQSRLTRIGPACARRPGAPVNLAGTYRGQYNMGPLTPHSDPYYVYATGARPGMVATFN